MLHTVHLAGNAEPLATINLARLHLRRNKYSPSLCFCGSASLYPLSSPWFSFCLFPLLFSLPTIHPPILSVFLRNGAAAAFRFNSQRSWGRAAAGFRHNCQSTFPPTSCSLLLHLCAMFPCACSPCLSGHIRPSKSIHQVRPESCMLSLRAPR